MERINSIGTLILELILEIDFWTGYSRQNNPKKTLTFLALHIFGTKNSDSPEIRKFSKFLKYLTCRQDFLIFD